MPLKRQPWPQLWNLLMVDTPQELRIDQVPVRKLAANHVCYYTMYVHYGSRVAVQTKCFEFLHYCG